MANYCFFSPEAQELAEKCGIDKVIVDFAESAKKQAYVLRAPLAKSDSEYDYENAIALFISGMRPCFIDIGGGVIYSRNSVRIL
jgi:superfamily I DNA and RNA helicase